MKVLIIGNFWPYRGGSKRVIGLAKYLPKFGWEPTILTEPLAEKPKGFNVIEVGRIEDTGDQLKRKYGNIRGKKILKFFFNLSKEILAYPDEHRYWKKVALEAVKERPDAIISVWPTTSHLIAKELKEMWKVPWIADLPDLWSQNCAYPFGRIRRFFDRRLELKVLKKADILTTVSEPMAQELRELHRKKVVSITHGFDDETLNEPPVTLTKKPTITYTGTLYGGQRDISKLFKALKGKDIEARFYGPKDDYIEKNIKEYKLDNAKQYGLIPHGVALQRQRESHLLWLPKWEGKNKGVYSGKVFEYLAAKRPIFATGGTKDVITDLLKETNTGAKTLKDTKYRGNYKIHKYSQSEMAIKFVNLLNKLCT